MNSIIRKTLFLFLFLLVAVGGAFAVDFSIGASGALYMADEEFDNSSGEDIWSQFEDGENIYYGVNAEFLFDKWALGLYTYFSFYTNDIYDDSGEYQGAYDMMDADVNISLSYHLFGATSFFDPFLEGGAGTITKNINSVYGTDNNIIYGDDPNEEPFAVQGSQYWFAGIGLGFNIGKLGIFSKVQYHGEAGEVEVSYDDAKGDDLTSTYTPDLYPLSDLKVILGAKMIF